MVLDNLGSSLRGSLDKLRGKSRLDEDIEDIVKEIQRSLFGRRRCRARTGPLEQYRNTRAG